MASQGKASLPCLALPRTCLGKFLSWQVADPRQWTPKDKKADLLIRGQSDQILCEVAKAFDVAIPSYSESDDPLIALATALNENDPKPSTPFLNMVENNPKFQVESNNFKTNFKEHYTPGWYGKGMKKN